MFTSFAIKLFGERLGVVFGRFLPYALCVLLVLGAYYLIRWDAYNDGVEDTTLIYENAILAERERVQARNQRALDIANSRIEELQDQVTARDEELIQLRQEASEDPNADRESVGPDSVRRLNQIR